jgi:hypothetical protein
MASAGCFLILLSWEGKSAAQDLPRDWTSLRHAGTGFATVTTSNDSESAFANPAGLARMRNPRSRDSIHEIQFPRISIEGPEPQMDLISNTLFTSPEELFPKIGSKLEGKSGNFEQFFSVNTYPSVVFGGKSKPTFLIGLYGTSGVTIRRDAAQEAGLFDLTQETTIGATLGLAGVTRAGTLAYGLSIRPNARYIKATENNTFGPDQPPNPQTSVLKMDRTVSVGLDAGMLFTAADFWLPTFGLAIRNIPLGCADAITNPFTGQSERICGAKRQGKSADGLPRTQLDPTELRAGLSITPRFRVGKDKLNLRISGEASPIAIANGDTIYGIQNVPLEQMLKAGLEVFFGHPLMLSGFALRAGVFNAEPTWGLTTALYALQIEYASYVRQTRFDDESLGKERQHLLGISTIW